MFTIIKRNKYGNDQYAVGGNLLPTGDIWTIRDPPQGFEYPDTIKRVYNGVTYLLSPKATDVIPEKESEYSGSACLITVNDCFIMVIDNKPYIQNCQGMKLATEINPVDTMVREIFEELKIVVSPDRLKEIGSWTFNNNIELVDTVMLHKTILFHLECTSHEVAHIVSEFDHSKVIPFISDKITTVVTVPFSELDTLPEKIAGKTFMDHHREILRMFLKMPVKYECRYLKEFKLQ